MCWLNGFLKSFFDVPTEAKSDFSSITSLSLTRIKGISAPQYFREELLILTKQLNEEQWVLRLWPSRFILDNEQRILVGNIALHRKNSNGLIVRRIAATVESVLSETIPWLTQEFDVKQVQLEGVRDEANTVWPVSKTASN